MDRNKVIFIIAHKYFRGYESYVEYYVNNIRNFYEKSLIIVVDNNSIYKDDIFDKLKIYDNVILLDNNIESKHEIGAYNVGLKYLIDNNLLKNYDYVTMTQDNFIIKNKLDFNKLYEENVYACPINGCHTDISSIHGGYEDFFIPILSNLNLNNNLDKISFCWCLSFIVSTNKIEQLYDYLKEIIITTRWESCVSERFMARILWELNDHRNYDIDGDFRTLITKYDCWNVDLYGYVPTFFAKRVQRKNENTVDI
jgi:hypothetical protein